MKQEINLEKILLSKIPKDCYWEEMGNLTNCPKEYILSAIKEACNQCLDLAAENIKVQALEDFGSECPDCWSEDSILQIKNLIK